MIGKICLCPARGGETAPVFHCVYRNGEEDYHTLGHKLPVRVYTHQVQTVVYEADYYGAYDGSTDAAHAA